MLLILHVYRQKFISKDILYFLPDLNKSDCVVLVVPCAWNYCLENQ